MTRIQPEQIAELSSSLSTRLDESLQQIGSINQQSRILSLNARIEAARSGESGKAFSVVACEMGKLSERTTEVANALSLHVRETAHKLESISSGLANQVRGVRLSDLALNNIDLIDRNLYERSCDCRWWATDSSLVDALTSDGAEQLQYASKRLGVILDSYTVYYDLVLADARGNIVANGRPQQFASKGLNHGQSEWFRTAWETRSGQEFGFESVHESSLVGHRRVLVYSCGVRAGGEVNGKLLGVLGIVFNWDALAQTIVDNTPLYGDEHSCTRVCICDEAGKILAERGPNIAGDLARLPGRAEIFAEKKGYVVQADAGKRLVLAHARAPGFETYTTGWHSLIVQEMS